MGGLRAYLTPYDAPPAMPLFRQFLKGGQGGQGEVYTHIYSYTYTHILIYIYTHILIYSYSYTHTYTHTHLHTYTHTHRGVWGVWGGWRDRDSGWRDRCVWTSLGSTSVCI
jgi:hypothetical protein